MKKVESADALRMFVDSAAVYAYVADYETDELLMVNNYYTGNLGVSGQWMEGHKCWEFVNGEDGGRCPFCPRGKNALSEGKAGPGNYTNYTTEVFNPTLGIWGRLSCQEITWVDGRQAHIVTVIDISEEKLLREELSHIAYYDKNLGLPNRAKFEKDLSGRRGNNFCIIAYDYISLRRLNDAYGRLLVNALLETAINWIKAFDLQQCEIYRVDSDEFFVLIDNADMISASGLAGLLEERFREPWEISIDGGQAAILCNIAICVVDGRLGFENPNELFSLVDRTLNIAKETKKVSVYDKSLDTAVKRELALEVSLKKSVHADMAGFSVCFQPIADPNLEKWIGLEALCRWTSPEFGPVSPRVFIHAAEQIGVINKIGYWVLDTAIGICSRLGLNGVDGFFLDVNLSPSQMSDELFIGKALQSLRKHAFPARCLTLEVTESQDLESSGYQKTVIDRLKSMDINIALDDFGTGYSNFNNLRNLPVDTLKIEKQFTEGIATDDYQKFLAKILIDLAHAAGMDLIAEGVESAGQMKELIKSGADFLQGYLFAKPLTVTELEGLLHKFRERDEMLTLVKQEILKEKRDALR